MPQTSGSSAPASALARFLPPVLLLALMWVVEAADAVLPGSFEVFGIRAWDVTHLQGILLAPLLHSTWSHLIANSVPFLVLGILVAAEGGHRFWAVTAIVALVGGVGPWLLAVPGTVTVGASGLVFGYFAYLLVRVKRTPPGGRRVLQIVIAVLVVAVYGGSMLTGVLPVSPGVSWQGHLSGAVGGVCAGLLLRGSGAPRPARSMRA
jgi:membrane associated rhomboid family serine protease